MPARMTGPAPACPAIAGTPPAGKPVGAFS